MSFCLTNGLCISLSLAALIEATDALLYLGHDMEKEEEVITMSDQPIPICGTHEMSKQWRPTTFEYEEDGVSIRVPNIYAWVCPSDGEASFTPETVDELIDTVRDLITPAKRARKRRSMPTEYIVRVD